MYILKMRKEEEKGVPIIVVLLLVGVIIACVLDIANVKGGYIIIFLSIYIISGFVFLQCKYYHKYRTPRGDFQRVPDTVA